MKQAPSPRMNGFELAVIFVVVCGVLLIRRGYPEIPQWALFVGGMIPVVLVVGLRFWRFARSRRRNRT